MSVLRRCIFCDGKTPSDPQTARGRIENLAADDDTSRQGFAPALPDKALLLLCLQMGKWLKRANFDPRRAHCDGKPSSRSVMILPLFDDALDQTAVPY